MALIRIVAAFLISVLLAVSPAAAQDESTAEQVERAFALLGLEGAAVVPTTDPARIAEGLQLLEAAAAAGEGVAQNALGMAYANGLYGLEVDVVRAIALYEDAMDSEIVGTIARLNWGITQYVLGNAALAVPRLEEVHASDSEAAPAAAATLAEAYALGRGVDADYLRAGALYEEAVAFNPNDLQSHYMLGRGYEAGFFEGGVQSERALAHYQAAADLGDPRSAWKVGMAHLDGEPGFAGGSVEAYAWVRRSAEGGHIQGMLSTAVMLATGDGVEKDPDDAASWYMQAAIEGSAHAMRGLGAMHYFDELGRESDRNLGRALLELGAEGGDETAKQILDSIEGDGGRIDREAVERFKAEWREKAAAPR